MPLDKPMADRRLAAAHPSQGPVAVNQVQGGA
jgi:hypothetical protein